MNGNEQTIVTLHEKGRSHFAFFIKFEKEEEEDSIL